jgi:hypothetical protein
MTTGTKLSVVGEKGGGYRFGREGKWAVGSFSSWAGLLPRGPFCFSISFLFFFFLFSFEIGLKLSRTSDLNFSHTLEFVKLFFWHLKHTGKVFDLREKQNLKKRCKCKKNAMHDMMHDFM